MDNFQEIKEIDAERVSNDAEVSNYLTVTRSAPVTQGGLAYSQTCIVDFEYGAWPDWFKALKSSFRRLDTNLACGFVSSRYTAIPLTALVSNRPGDAWRDYARVLKAAKEAGWDVKEHTKGTCFNAIPRRT